MMDPRELRPSEIPNDYRGAFASVAFLLRSLRGVVRKVTGEHRMRSFPEEVTNAIEGEHAPGDTCSTWLTGLARRWDVSLAACPVGDDGNLLPMRVYLGDGRFASWDVVASRVPSYHLDRIVCDADLLATFACRYVPSPDAEDYDAAMEADAATLDVTEPARPVAPWVPDLALMGEVVEPSRWRSLWVAEGPFAHGADERNGNVVAIRRMPVTDGVTGEQCEVPFLSGNAARGVGRRILAGDMLDTIGLTVPQMSIGRAHTILDGGTLEGGSPKIDAQLRRDLRALMPFLDLYGGNWDRTQTMGGWLLMEPAILVCRETAGLFARALAPKGVSAAQWRESLMPAAALVSQQQLTSRPSELDDPESPVLARVEVVTTGSLFVHRIATHGRAGYGETPALVLSALARLVELLRERGAAGAANARGMGRLLMGEYMAEGGAGKFPTSDLYREHLRKNADAIRTMLTSGPVRDAPAEKEKPAKKPRGKKGVGDEPATAAAPPAEAPEAQPSLL